MPIFKLKKEFPKVLVLPGDYASYARYSSDMFDIVRRYADDVEEYSIDECFADLTGLDKPLYMTYREIAERIKREIEKELGLSVTIGLAPTKVLAKVASKWIKPNGLTVIQKSTAKDFLAGTSIEKIWGIGYRTAYSLNKKGIQTALDFAQKDIEWIKREFSKPYEVIWLELNGISVHGVDPEPKHTYSSIQKTRTFHPVTNDKTFLLSQFSRNIEEACRKARHYELVPKSVSFFLKNQDFRYASWGTALSSPTNSPESLISLVRGNIGKMHKQGVLYRTTGVTLHELAPARASQQDLFGGTETTGKFEHIHKQIDMLDEKIGKRAIYLASTHNALKQKKVGTDSDDLNRDLLFL